MQYVKHKNYLVLLLAPTVLMGILLLFSPARVHADPTCTPEDMSGCTADNCSSLAGGTWDFDAKKCGNGSFDPAASNNKCATLDKCDLMTKYINPLIQLLAALVGVAVVASIIIGGIQYSSSSGDPQRTSAAKARIRNAIIALVTFIFLYALLNFLVPGGLFNK
jgi:hypothetical protein